MVRSFARGVLAATVLVAGLAVVPAVLAADHGVTIAGFAFSPQTITVAVGDTVTWTNQDGTNHTATADGGAFDSGTIGNGASKTVTFSTAGTFSYHCAIHASMTGTVVVNSTAPATDTSGVVSSTRVGSGPLAVLALVAAAGLVLGAWRTRTTRRTRVEETSRR